MPLMKTSLIVRHTTRVARMEMPQLSFFPAHKPVVSRGIVNFARAALTGLLCLLSPMDASAKKRPTPLAGVNISGAEFGALPGVHTKDYIYPGAQEYDFAATRGFSLVRLPFSWERLQPKPLEPFAEEEESRLDASIQLALTRGLNVILDPHNYGRRNDKIIGSSQAPDAQFADLWARMAKRYANKPGVIFGLMNEPHDQPLDQWAKSAQAAIDAIRATGARNLVLAPGGHWTGAHAWMAGPPGQTNGDIMLRLTDPADALAFEFHQYLDKDWSGTSGECRPPQEVVAALKIATDWLRTHKKKGFLGEFGAGANDNCQAGLSAMLQHLNDNAHLWVGWAYWAAGPWWPPEYPLSLQPVDGKERPQMETLRKYMGARAPLLEFRK
jgi:endoglucanase